MNKNKRLLKYLKTKRKKSLLPLIKDLELYKDNWFTDMERKYSDNNKPSPLSNFGMFIPKGSEGNWKERIRLAMLNPREPEGI